MDPYEALVAALVEIANDIVAERVAPADGADALFSYGSSLESLAESLAVFRALSSEWDEHRAIDSRIDSRPERRAAIERDILIAADRFRARYD